MSLCHFSERPGEILLGHTSSSPHACEIMTQGSEIHNTMACRVSVLPRRMSNTGQDSKTQDLLRIAIAAKYVMSAYKRRGCRRASVIMRALVGIAHAQ